MKINWFALGAVLFFGGCSHTPPSKSYRDILKSVIPMTKRLDTLAQTLRKASIGLCGEMGEGKGIITHRLSDYPQNFQAVAASLWNLGTKERVLYVRPNSKAAIQGLAFGDVYKNESQPENTGCGYEVRVRVDGKPNAYADGVQVFVTSGLLGSIDDLPLSLVIAHEMAHNVLGHVEMDITPSNEREADRWAVFLLARAELDYNKAVADPMSIGTKIGENQNTQERATHFKNVITEIKSLQKQDAPLVP